MIFTNNHTVPKTILSKKMRDFRRDNDLAQKQFASMIGVSRSAVGSYEEMRALPDLFVLSSIMTIVGFSFEELKIK